MAYIQDKSVTSLIVSAMAGNVLPQLIPLWRPMQQWPGDHASGKPEKLRKMCLWCISVCNKDTKTTRMSTNHPYDEYMNIWVRSNGFVFVSEMLQRLWTPHIIWRSRKTWQGMESGHTVITQDWTAQTTAHDNVTSTATLAVSLT